MLYRQTTFLACGLVAVVLCGCGGKQKDNEPVVTVQVAPVQRSTIRQVVSSEAVLYPLHEADLTPKISAPVKKFYVNRGDKVHRGQLLAVLENSDLQAAAVENKGALQQAQANYQTQAAATIPQEQQKAQLDVQQTKAALDAAQKLYDSRQKLYREGALPRKDVDASRVALAQARTQYETARAQLSALQAGGTHRALEAARGQLTTAQGKYLGASAQLNFSEIRSPINGVVTDRLNYPGEVPPAGAPLITVMDLSQVIAKAHVPEEQAALLKPGDPATINAGGISFPAHVTLVNPALDPNSTTVEVWVEAANPKHELRPGASVQVSIVARQVPDAVVVPASALLKTPQGAASVMLAGADDRAHQREVQTGIQQDNQVQITAGLQPGDRVITSGAYGLPDNTRIKVEARSGESATPPRGGP